MKTKISKREKVLLVILILLIIGSLYYVLFYTPTQEQIAAYEAEYAELDDTVILYEAKAMQMKKMQQELEVLKAEAETSGTIKEVPLYDNNRKLMESLNLILDVAQEYSVTFNSTEASEQIVRREVALNYKCKNYKQAKKILENIHDDHYPSIIKDVRMEFDTEEGEVSVMMTLTYFEYQQTN